MSNVNNASQEKRKKCKHCKKTVVISPVDCVVCSSSYHPSCAVQARVAGSDLIVNCCNTKESEVILDSMDEKRLKSLVEKLFGEHLNPFKKKIQEEVGDIKKSVQFISDSFDEQKQAIDKMLLEMKLIRDENNMLKQKLQTLEDRINAKEQKEKENNLLIVGIPKQNEEPKKIVEKILKKMKVPVRNNDLLEAYRVSKKEDAPIAVKLINQDIKQNIMKTIRQLKGIRVRECELQGADKNIYFNDDLTRQNQYLFKLTREYKQRKGLKSAYVSNGKIYLKKSDSDTSMRIRTEADLN